MTACHSSPYIYSKVGCFGCLSPDQDTNIEDILNESAHCSNVTLFIDDSFVCKPYWCYHRLANKVYFDSGCSRMEAMLLIITVTYIMKEDHFRLRRQTLSPGMNIDYKFEPSLR